MHQMEQRRLVDYYSGSDSSVKLINGSMDNPISLFTNV